MSSKWVSRFLFFGTYNTENSQYISVHDVQFFPLVRIYNVLRALIVDLFAGV